MYEWNGISANSVDRLAKLACIQKGIWDMNGDLHAALFAISHASVSDLDRKFCPLGQNNLPSHVSLRQMSDCKSQWQ